MCLLWRSLGLYVGMCPQLWRFAAHQWLCKFSFNEFLLTLLREIHGLILSQRVGAHVVPNLNLVSPANDDVRHRPHHRSFICFNFIFWLSLILSLNLILFEDGDQARLSHGVYLFLFLQQQGLNWFLVGWGNFLNEDLRVSLILLFPKLDIYLRLEVDLIQRGAIWREIE